MHKLPMNLQLFAEPGAGDPGAGGTGSTGAGGTGSQQGQGAPAFDYEKLAGLISGKQAVTEETILKNYFKEQGLSKEEMSQAISSFKQQKAANQPDVAALQTQATQAQETVKQTQIENAAILQAMGLGLDAKTIPYVMKMADLSQAMNDSGEINNEAIKNALNKVLEDVPALKPQAGQSTGFTQVGAGAGGGTKPDDEALKAAFGL